MLILTRKVNEAIMISDDIIITVLEIQGDKVSLGIEAPKEIPVHRREIYEAIQAENKQAANSLGVADLSVVGKIFEHSPKEEKRDENST